MEKIPDELIDVRLQSADGASALISLHGAHLLSWIPAGGSEALFMSGHTGVGGSAAIRGGVPIIFPQFAERGAGRRHGFARTARWRLESAGVEAGSATARFVLTQADMPQSAWPHQFRLQYAVTVSKQTLQLALVVDNPSAEEWSFNSALHTYLRASNVENVRITGLQGIAYLDQVENGRHCVSRERLLQVRGEIDRIYLDTPGTLVLQDHARTIRSEQRGFRDTVIWNPGSLKAAQLHDLTPGTHSHFLCLEAAAVARPISLAPGSSWRGEQILTSL